MFGFKTDLICCNGELQITTTDGQSIQVMTTVDGQTIPLQLMTHDGQHITSEMESQLQHVGVENSEDMVSAITVSKHIIKVKSKY
jgi:thioredoxin reductase